MTRRLRNCRLSLWGTSQETSRHWYWALITTVWPSTTIKNPSFTTRATRLLRALTSLCQLIASSRENMRTGPGRPAASTKNLLLHLWKSENAIHINTYVTQAPGRARLRNLHQAFFDLKCRNPPSVQTIDCCRVAQFGSRGPWPAGGGIQAIPPHSEKQSTRSASLFQRRRVPAAGRDSAGGGGARSRHIRKPGSLREWRKPAGHSATTEQGIRDPSQEGVKTATQTTDTTTPPCHNPYDAGTMRERFAACCRHARVFCSFKKPQRGISRSSAARVPPGS